jgi:hypothetical protein
VGFAEWVVSDAVLHLHKEWRIAHLKNGGVLRIGTDDAPDLAHFLEEKIAQQGT